VEARENLILLNMKKILRYIVVGAVVLLVGGFVIADTVNQEVHILEDGDMEDADGDPVSAWTVTQNATLTKEAGGVDDGSQVLRVAYNGSTNPQARQVVLTVGKNYRFTGWARGDGSKQPRVLSADASITWTGTNSTDWQYFDVSGTATNINFDLRCVTTGAGYAEFDDIMVTEYTPPIVNNEVGILGDGDFENAGIGDWSVPAGTMTKETGAVNDGVQVGRITSAGGLAYFEEVAGISVGTIYRCTGWARSDGAVTASVYCGKGSNDWSSSSGNWEYYDVTATATTTRIAYAVSNAGWAEFEDALVTEYTPPMVNDNVQVLADGDMELAGVASWGSHSDATRTKVSGWVDDGSQILRITATVQAGGQSPQAEQSILDVGKEYRMTGWVRSDGTEVPWIYNAPATLWTGTNATSWQYFDFTFTATHITASFVFSITDPGGTEYVEFDDIFVTETAPQYNNYGQLLVDGDMEVAETLGAELLVDNDMEEDGTDIFFSNKFDLTQAANITADSGVVTGDVTPHSCAGAEFDGTNDYVIYTIPSTLFSEKSSLSIVVEFTPDFAADDGVNYYLVDSDNGARYLIFKNSNNNLQLYLGNTNIENLAVGTYGGYWNQNGRNVLAVSSNGVLTNAWLNGNQILTNKNQAWSPTAPTNFNVGSNYNGGSKFDGEIHAVSIYDGLLDGTDAQNLYDSVDTDDWAAGNNVCTTKQLGAAESGSQVIRSAYDGVSYPFVWQNTTTSGVTYRVTGWARSDGTGIPRVSTATGTPLWEGTNSTSWQYFDFTGDPLGVYFRFVNQITGASYVEFDDVTTKEITNDGADAWTVGNSAILSKESTDPQSGSLNLRITYNAVNNPYASQSVLTDGVSYRVTGWARGDGTGNPALFIGGANRVWTGTSSTSWQYFDETGVSSGAAAIYLRTDITEAGYSEFDGVVVTRTD